MNSRVKTMTEIAMVAALAVLLSVIKIYQAPFGGSVSLVMVPIFLFAFRRGIGPAMIAGALTGTIKIMTDAYVVHPIQFLLDYPVAYLVLGLAGIYRIKKDQSIGMKTFYISLSIIFATFFRLLSHVASGVIWFGSYAPESMNVYLYSIVYNLYYLVPEMIISIIVTALVVQKVPNFVINYERTNIKEAIQ